MMSIGLLWLQTARQDRVERVHRLGGELGQLAAAADERVGGEDARARRRWSRSVRLRPARPRLLGEDLGDVEQVGDRVDAQHADPPERGVEHLVGAGQRAGVRRRRLGRLRRAARA